MITLSLRIFCLGLLSLSSLLPISQAAERVESELYQPAPFKAELGQTQLKLSALNPANRRLNSLLFPIPSLQLGVPSTTELAALQQHKTQHRALKIGIERQIPALPELQDWVWMPVLDGQAAQFMLSSEAAANLRALLQLDQPLPKGVELRVFSLEASAEVFGAYQQADFTQLDTTQPFQLWTPTVSGSALGLEVFIPTGIDPAQIKLTIPQISHIDYDLKTEKFKLSDSFLKFSSCDLSMACAPAAWQTTAKAVARYIFTDATGSSYLCTGTLLADKDTSTQIPYLSTAAHCINEASAAASMDFYWLYQETSCGSGYSTWVRTTGGADLLATRSELDSSLVRIRTPPPVGVVLSGWALEALPASAAVVGIHHGSGYPQQFSQGKFVSYASILSTPTGYMVTKDPLGNFTQVTWTEGITAQGSSGSGLWFSLNDQAYFKGSLVGGSSSCAEPNAPDEYTRLERFHPYVATWLESKGEPLASLLNTNQPLNALVDGIIIARYLAGQRGDQLTRQVATTPVNWAELEAKLDLLKPILDIDGDHRLEADKDGLLIIRYLLGLKDAALIAQLDFTDSQRKTITEINQYIETLLF
ncbi:hypothetical protein SAMN02745130_02966 [Thiothrix eikelboomii]|uniref:Trypsin-like peptidase domain-containing protein n=1 Tax=Thiothrix eikelboomii TaxID=92487 RepID=A0A1T4XHG9_9GAMM|nr:hypothetical protein [Thiothrix eikelboomii]SKA88578.1 hypothetical protein SAMN02745130_02966 [Thiothrix eikelboomii]